MAFDWIESHRGLRDHPKTVLLAAAWADRKTCVIGHLHELWWWTLEYAPDGVIRPAFYPQLLIACEWHGKPEKFWEGLLQVGFLDALADGYVVHDWEEYALRRLTRLKKDVARKRDVRAEIAGLSGPQPPDKPQISGAKAPDKPPISGGVSAGQAPPVSPDTSGTHATRGRDKPTDLPDSRGSEEPLLSTPDLPPKPPNSDADAQGPSGTASAQIPDDGPVPIVLLREGGALCPLCRLPYEGPYIDHTAQHHRVRQVADDLGTNRRRRAEIEAPPPDVAAQFAAMHERLQAVSELPSA